MGTEDNLLREVRAIRREMRDLREMLSLSTDLMQEDEACAFLGIAKKTLQNKIYDGSLDGTFIINRAGRRMFYRSKLI